MPFDARVALGGGDGTFRVRDMQIPDPVSSQVVVRLGASGVCHTDYDSMTWGQDLLLGHEGAGTVVAAGPDAGSVKVGDRVLLTWAIACGDCFQCDDGAEHLCEKTSPVVALSPDVETERAFGLGTLATYTLVPENAVVPIPDGLPFDHAAAFGCAVMTGYGSVFNAARVEPGANVVVLGCGSVGLSVIAAAQIAGAGQVLAIDRRPARLTLAESFGATATFLSEELALDAALEVILATARRGADYAFECTGVPALGAEVLLLVRNGGTVVQASGVESTIPVNMSLFEWDKTYINPLYGQCRPSRDFPRLFELYAKGQLFVDQLVTHRYALDDLQRAFDNMLNGVGAKGVVVFDH